MKRSALAESSLEETTLKDSQDRFRKAEAFLLIIWIAIDRPFSIQQFLRGQVGADSKLVILLHVARPPQVSQYRQVS